MSRKDSFWISGWYQFEKLCRSNSTWLAIGTANNLSKMAQYTLTKETQVHRDLQRRTPYPRGQEVSLAVYSCSAVAKSLWPTELLATCQASLSFTNSQSLLKLMSTESMMPFNHLALGHPLLLQPSIFPSIKVFSNESALCITWPKYCNFSFSISPSSEYSGLISFRI